MFHTITVRGVRGQIVLGARTAAALPTWRVQKTLTGGWILAGDLERADPFLCRQRPLYFAAPRGNQGHWYFPVTAVSIDGKILRADLRPPEQ